MASAVVERMARTMYGHRIAALGIYPEGDVRFARAVDEGWHWCTGEAEADLKAMREPTPEMRHAGALVLSDGSREVWRLMIDVALWEKLDV